MKSFDIVVNGTVYGDGQFKVAVDVTDVPRDGSVDQSLVGSMLVDGGIVVLCEEGVRNGSTIAAIQKSVTDYLNKTIELRYFDALMKRVDR